MNEKKGIIETLGDYMNEIFDRDKDGIISIKEIFSVFPNMAVPIAIMFVDVLVLAAEYRVWDFGVHVTGNPLLAVGFVLVSAIPFFLGQVFWLYPRATLIQKAIAIAFICASLYTSAQFGLADLTKEYSKQVIFSFLVQLTVGYIVGTLIYIVFDPTIKANRMKKKAQDAATFEREIQGIANSILESLQETLQAKQKLASQFGEDEVEKALGQLRGRKRDKRTSTNTPVSAMNAETNTPPNPTLAGNEQPRQ